MIETIKTRWLVAAAGGIAVCVFLLLLGTVIFDENYSLAQMAAEAYGSPSVVIRPSCPSLQAIRNEIYDAVQVCERHSDCSIYQCSAVNTATADKLRQGDPYYEEACGFDGPITICAVFESSCVENQCVATF